MTSRAGAFGFSHDTSNVIILANTCRYKKGPTTYLHALNHIRRLLPLRDAVHHEHLLGPSRRDIAPAQPAPTSPPGPRIVPHLHTHTTKIKYIAGALKTTGVRPQQYFYGCHHTRPPPRAERVFVRVVACLVDTIIQVGRKSTTETNGTGSWRPFFCPRRQESEFHTPSGVLPHFLFC